MQILHFGGRRTRFGPAERKSSRLLSLIAVCAGEEQFKSARNYGCVPIKTLTLDATRPREQPMPLYHTVVHNCTCHSFDDVIFGLIRIVGCAPRDAELKAKEVDFFGSGIVATATFEVAELYAARLHDEVVSASGTLLLTSVRPA